MVTSNILESASILFPLRASQRTGLQRIHVVSITKQIIGVCHEYERPDDDLESYTATDNSKIVLYPRVACNTHPSFVIQSNFQMLKYYMLTKATITPPSPLA